MNAPKHFSKAMINSLASHLLFRINLQCITYFSNYGVREGDFGAEPDAVEISYFRDPYTIPGSSSGVKHTSSAFCSDYSTTDSLSRTLTRALNIRYFHRGPTRKAKPCSAKIAGYAVDPPSRRSRVPAPLNQKKGKRRESIFANCQIQVITSSA